MNIITEATIETSEKPIATTAPAKALSAFKARGFRNTINGLCEEIRALYRADSVPWIIGYSGGKDSTAVLQLIWMAVSALPKQERTKTIHVISTDTMVENPVVSQWVANSLKTMRRSAEAEHMPVQAELLHPRIEDSFWVNLIGKGYPAPRHKFRWCTERLKIRPSNSYISNVVTENGEAILVLGSRKAESTRRGLNMTKHETNRTRDRLSPNASLPGALVYTPIESWNNDDVWAFLTQIPNAWGYSNQDLLGMYAGASADGECPLVVDTSTPSCGSSRFGCWVCTLVEKDKSMSAMIQNDAELEWMGPLLDLRNLIDFREDSTARNPITGENELTNNKRDAFRGPVGKALAELLEQKSGQPIAELVRERDWERHLRDYRRLNSGKVQLMMNGREIPGPYIQEARECWLRALLAAQTHVRRHGPPNVRDIELITLDELKEIRRIWVMDKHELEDRLPMIYEQETGEKYPGPGLNDNLTLTAEDMQLLEDLCKNDRLHYELARELIGIVQQQSTQGRRAGLFQKMEKAFTRNFYDSREDAIDRARRLQTDLEAVQSLSYSSDQDEPLHSRAVAEDGL